ncbi:hypothetical protein CHUAL_010313 [Chamberlinius hualienensis]
MASKRSGGCLSYFHFNNAVKKLVIICFNLLCGRDITPAYYHHEEGKKDNGMIRGLVISIRLPNRHYQLYISGVIYFFDVPDEVLNCSHASWLVENTFFRSAYQRVSSSWGLVHGIRSEDKDCVSTYDSGTNLFGGECFARKEYVTL